MNDVVLKAIHGMLKKLPELPPMPSMHIGGQLRIAPPSHDPSDPASQRWYWRQIQRQAQIAEVHEPNRQGLSQRAISQRTGHHRATIKQWLQQPVPLLPSHTPAVLSELASLPAPQQRRAQRERRMQQVHALAAEGLSPSAIERLVGIHRLTVKSWLRFGSELAVSHASSTNGQNTDSLSTG